MQHDDDDDDDDGEEENSIEELISRHAAHFSHSPCKLIQILAFNYMQTDVTWPWPCPWPGLDWMMLPDTLVNTTIRTNNTFSSSPPPCKELH